MLVTKTKRYKPLLYRAWQLQIYLHQLWKIFWLSLTSIGYSLSPGIRQ